MSARPLTALIMTAFALAGSSGGCNKPAPPGEDVSSSAGPPIVICYLPDGAPCPLDAGDDGGEEGLGDEGGIDGAGGDGSSSVADALNGE
jgi:hypothetical protein